MGTIGTEGNLLADSLTASIVVVTVIKYDRMDEPTKRPMTDVVTTSNKAQDKKGATHIYAHLLEIDE